MLDNGYTYLAGVRLSAYRDAQYWALIVEELGWFNRTFEHDSVQNCLYLFGNCLRRPPGSSNDDFLYPTADGPEGPTFEGDVVSPQAVTIRIRERVVLIPRERGAYERRGILPMEWPKVMGFELLRWLAGDYLEPLLATEVELRERVPGSLARVLRLDEWRHPNIARGELPGSSATFQRIARALESGDPSLYVPEPANTHWRHWPEGGAL
jgi:hypothetical protein